jgi:RNA polymerase-binding transcription factor DksA
MAVGWAQDGAVQDQIDATVESAVKRARSRLAHGESLLACEECGEPIPEARRQALPIGIVLELADKAEKMGTLAFGT